MATYAAIFKSTDPGAPALSGTAGDLLKVLDECLAIGRLFTTANDSVFNDNSAEARLDGGVAFTLFPTPGTSDRAYFGMSVKFKRLRFDLATLGVGGAYQWEYWNGSTWTSLSVTDGTSGFTQDGDVTWTAPGDWATTTVNSQTRYWVRVRPTSAPSTNPTVNSCSSLGWLRAFEGVNKAAYRPGSGAGTRFYLRAQDDAPGAGGAREARMRGYESMTDVDTGSNPFPTVAQLAAGIICRKSATADATARAWFLVADDRTLYLGVLTGDSAGNYFCFAYGDFVSYVSGDLYNCMIIGRVTENSGTLSIENLGSVASTLGSVLTGHYLARSYAGVAGALQFGKHGDFLKGDSAHVGVDGLAYVNPSDGRIWVSPIWVIETAQPTVRGYLRGFWQPLHLAGSYSDADTFNGGPGIPDLTGRSFELKKGISNSTGTVGVGAAETTDTWNL